MESKKINQLATELAPELSDLTIIGDPTTGISKKITLSQMASLFTGTVEEYPNLASFPLIGTADTIYIALDTNIIYRWNTGTSAYVELSPNIVTSLVFNDANGFDGTISLVGSTATLTITTALTQGSIGFIGASGALTQDNSNFFWDNTNKRLGINTNTPTTAIDAFGSGIIGRLNGTSTNNAFLGFASAGSNKWSIGNVQSDHRFRIYSEANAAELVSVLQTGEVGIGIANPLTKLHIFGGASALIANLDANTSVAKSISFRSGNSSRINLEVSGTESGSNAGANFFIRRYSDAGSLIDTPLTITRSTGAITLAGALSGTSATFSGDLILDNGSADGGQLVLASSGFSNWNIDNFSGNLRAYYGSTEYLRIASTGSIGVGTTPPATTNFSHLFVGRNISMFSGSSTDIYIGSNFYYDGGFKVRYSEASAMINTNAGSIIFQNSSSGTAGGTFNGIERFRIANNGAITQSKDSIYGINTTDGADNGYLALCGAGADGDNRGGHIYLSGNERGADAGTVVLAAGNVSGGSIQFRTGASIERMRISNSGNVGIGTTNPTAPLDLWKTGGTAGILASFTDGTYSNLQITTTTTGTLLQTTVSSYLAFGTTQAERMRINADGNVGIGRTSNNAKLEVQGVNTTSNNYAFISYDSSIGTLFGVRNDGLILSGTSAVSPFNFNPGGRVMYVNSSGQIGSNPSTRESKININSLENIDYIYKLNPVSFYFRKTNMETYQYTDEYYDEIRYGFIADEVEPLNKDLVSYNTNEDGTKKMAGVEYISMIPVLVKAIQELKKEIDILKAK